MNIEHSESETVLWKDSQWSAIDGEICRVSDFNPWGSSVDTNGKVHAMDKTTPYAGVTVECKKLGKNATGFICHKEDFKHLWAAFKHTEGNENEEVLVIWTKKHYKKVYKFVAPIMPRLWVMVCSKEAYDLFDSDYRPELGGEARWDAMRPIIEWKPEVME